MTKVEPRSVDERKQLALAEKARYNREWRKNHPGKQAEYCRRYWDKKARERQAMEEQHTEPAE